MLRARSWGSNLAQIEPIYLGRVLNRGVHVIRIVIGIIIFAIGFMSWLGAQSSPDGGVIWTGGMIVGGILVFTGLLKLSRERL